MSSTTANLLVQLSGGRKPQWSKQTDALSGLHLFDASTNSAARLGPPRATSDGVALNIVEQLPVLETLVSVQNRVDISKRAMVLTLSEVTSGDQIDIWLNGGSGDKWTYTAASSDTSVEAAALATAITSSAYHTARLTVSASANIITVTGKDNSPTSETWTDYELADITITGSGDTKLATVIDASVCSFYLYGLPGGIAYPGSGGDNTATDTWCSIPLDPFAESTGEVDTDYRGLTRHLSDYLRGMQRAYLEVFDVAGPGSEASSLTLAAASGTSTNTLTYQVGVYFGPCGRDTAT